MDRFHAIQVFVSVADQGGFAAAARSLGMSPPSVTRAVAMLEDRLGARLFVRTTRSVRLTQAGERFLLDSRRILAELEDAENAAVGSHADPRGELFITAPVLFGRMFVAPVLGDFLDRYPQMTARTLFVDRIVNLMDEGLDVSIRIGELPDSSLTAVRVGAVRQVMFASPGYLEREGSPRKPGDLSRHQLVYSTAMGASTEWLFQDRNSTVSMRPGCAASHEHQ